MRGRRYSCYVFFSAKKTTVKISIYVYSVIDKIVKLSAWIMGGGRGLNPTGNVD